MTFEAAREGGSRSGFTDRQARFLVTVMLHSGVCMDRHYCAFARIVYGQKTTRLLQSLVAESWPRRTYARTDARGSSTSITSPLPGDRRARQPFRKPTPIGAAIERLMVLDAV